MDYDPDAVYSWYSQHVQGLMRSSQFRALCFCPFHDDRAGGQRSGSIELSAGLFKCHSVNCDLHDAGLNLVTFARKLKVNLPTWVRGRNWARIFAKVMKNNKQLAIDYLLYRGLPEAYVLRMANSNQFGYDEYNGERWVVFPLYDETIDIVGLNKISIDGPDKRVNGRLSGSFWVEHTFDWNLPIVVVEGILNALSVNVVSGYQALAVVSATNVSVPRHLLSADQTIFMFDNDPAGRAIARNYARRIGGGRAVRWGNNCPKGFDPNDLLKGSTDFHAEFGLYIDSAEEVNTWTDAKTFLATLYERRNAFIWS